MSSLEEIQELIQKKYGIEPSVLDPNALAQRAASEGPRCMRTIGDPPINPSLSGEEGVCSREIC